MKGILIVIDGTDGSGKATQTKKLISRLDAEGYKVKTLDFPQYYSNFFGELIGKGLKGDFGDWAGLHPKIASIMYACDRFESKDKINSWLEKGCVVILDRFVSSNQIHQGGKIHDEDERKEFIKWLDVMEHQVFSLPKPDSVLYLNVPIKVSQKLLHQKENQSSKKYLEGKKDQHEGNIQHLEDARISALKMIAEVNIWQQVECTSGGSMKTIENIHNQIYKIVKDLIIKKK